MQDTELETGIGGIAPEKPGQVSPFRAGCMAYAMNKRDLLAVSEYGMRLHIAPEKNNIGRPFQGCKA